MRNAILLAMLASQAGAQKPDMLREFSASLEALSQNAGRAVVQVFSTALALNEDAEGGASALITRQRSSGSGVLLSPDGYIVTNAHVVSAARRIRVQLPSEPRGGGHHSVLAGSGRTLEAKVVGVDRDTDLAVLKVEGQGFPYLNLGDSETLRQGQLVMALGNPMGLQNSVTVGVVSSVARQLKPDDPMIYIQTDAPINPGNSGGPLVDIDSRVMGINTFILTQSGGSEGIGFAIPSNIVRNVYGQIRKEGHVHRSEIGAYVQTITPVLATGLHLPQNSGVLVGDIEPGGPAADGGLQVGDIVLAVNGKQMENARQLQVNLYSIPVGQKARFDVLRGGSKLTVDVAVAEQDDDPQRFADLVDPEKNLIPKLGILGVQIDRRIAEMLPDIRKKYGVVVAAQAAGAPIVTGLRAGDIIYSLNGVPMATVDALRSALDQLKPGAAVVLQIEREGRLEFLGFEIE